MKGATFRKAKVVLCILENCIYAVLNRPISPKDNYITWAKISHDIEAMCDSVTMKFLEVAKKQNLYEHKRI